MADRKRTADLNWEDLRVFTALARHGTLSATARALRVNHATVSRRVAGLETVLRTSLFDRRADGYALTAEGRAILEEAAPMEEAAVSVLRRLDRGVAAGGLVRLTTTRVLADRFLVERLGEFHRRHPDIDLELLTESREFSLARREADIALRFGAPKDSTLVARKLATVCTGFYGTPEWRDRVAAGERPDLVGFDADSGAPPEAAWLGREFPDHRVVFRSNGWTAQAMAADAGFGVALLPCWLAAAVSGLVRVPLGREPPAGALWMLIRPDLVKVPRVRAVADHLRTLFEANRSLFTSGD